MSGLFQLTPSASVTSAQRSKICHSPQFVLDLFLSGYYSVQPHFFMSFDNVSHLCICSSVTQLCGSLDRWISFPLLRFLIAYCSRTLHGRSLLTLPILGCSRLKQSCSKQFETFVGPRSMFLLIDINHFVSAETSEMLAFQTLCLLPPFSVREQKQPTSHHFSLTALSNTSTHRLFVIVHLLLKLWKGQRTDGSESAAYGQDRNTK